MSDPIDDPHVITVRCKHGDDAGPRLETFRYRRVEQYEEPRWHHDGAGPRSAKNLKLIATADEDSELYDDRSGQQTLMHHTGVSYPPSLPRRVDVMLSTGAGGMVERNRLVLKCVSGGHRWQFASISNLIRALDDFRALGVHSIPAAVLHWRYETHRRESPSGL